MLRITSRTDRDVTTVKLSGKLASAWVDEFATYSRRLLQRHPPEHVTFDLIDVTGVDAAGKKILAEVAEAGAWLVYGDPVMQAVVEQMLQTNRPQHPGPR